MLRQAGAVPIGGGTDLLVCIEEGLLAPDAVVDVRAVAGRGSSSQQSGALRIAAGTTVAELAEDSTVRARFPVLASACEAVGTPALRNAGTIGGNLCQRPRCWYFRRAIPCFKNGGSSCPAEAGENQYHAILDGGPCHIVHPSDPAVALAALGARIEIAGASAQRVVAIEDFFVLPRERLDSETVLQSGEIVTAVLLDAEAADGRQLYRKLMQRGAWDFALVSVAAVLRADGTVRIRLGGVAPRPWRVPESVEEDVAAGGLDEDSIAALVERALSDAKPLAGNAYKVPLAAAALRDAIRDLVA